MEILVEKGISKGKVRDIGTRCGGGHTIVDS